jgi:hypothetical protein
MDASGPQETHTQHLSEVPCGTTTTGRWDVLIVAGSLLTGEAMASGMMSVISGFPEMGTSGYETVCLIMLMLSLCVRAGRQQKHVVVSSAVSPSLSCSPSAVGSTPNSVHFSRHAGSGLTGAPKHENAAHAGHAIEDDRLRSDVGRERMQLEEP